MSRADKFFPHFQETITHTCLTYMLFHDNSNVNTYNVSTPIFNSHSHHPNICCRPQYPFLCYSLIHWGYHASKLQHSMENEIIAFLDSACCRKIPKILHSAIISTSALIPLHFAVEYGLSHITKVLLDRGDDPCQCTTPLLVTAIDSENLEMVKLLLDQDEIDPNIGSFWITPLCYVARCGNTQIVEMLLQSDRVNVNHTDPEGCTPLMMAVDSGHISSVEVLLKHPRTDILAQDKQGRPAYAYAFRRYQERLDYSDTDGMIALLEKYGGRPQTDYEPIYLMATCLSNELSISNSGFRIPLDSSTTFPAEDLMGPPPCHDTDGYPIYIGSAIFKSCVLPCKIVPHLPVPCLVPFRYHVIAHTGRYDLLHFNPDAMEFVRLSYEEIPYDRRPVKGGHDQDGTPLYHGVAVVNGMRIPATISRRW